VQAESRRAPPFGGLRDLTALALPIVAVQVGLMAMGVVDSILVGRVSAVALAGVALGNIYFFGCACFAMGVLLALDPLVAQAVGAGDREGISRALQRGLLLSLALTVPASLLLLTSEPVLYALGQPREVVPVAAAYVLREMPGVFPFLAFIVFRQTLQSLGRVRDVVAAIILGNVVNAFLNWVLIFGHLGAPPLGVVGSAWATTASRWGMLALLVALAWKPLGPHLRPWRHDALATRPLLRMIVLGAPIGGQMQLEFGIFGVVALLMGRFGTVAVAAHQIALNLASFTFMVPLGVSQAGAVLVGRAIGAGDVAAARRAARSSLAMGVGFMAVTAIVFLVAPRILATVYSPDPAVVALAAALIPVAGVFQVFDGLQVVSSGVLRGAGDTAAPFAINILGFWLAGFPVSLWLGFRTELGPVGLWWGFVVGLATVGLLLVWRVQARLRGPLARIAIERPAAG
jgi:MATE family multidrug resistance protein